MFDFDKPVNRRNTYSLKWDVLDSELPMWVADMDFETAPCVKEALKKRVEIGAYGYSVIPDEYFLSYKSFWERRHNFSFSLDWMIFSTGVVPAISSIVRKITTVAENVLICSPVYNIFYNSIYNNGRNIISSDLVYENGEYHIDFIDLEKKMKNPQTTLMILCNPHNPIGKIWSREELSKIGHLAKENNVVVLSDEIHCDLVDNGYSYTPFQSVNDECKYNSITCIAASKCFNLAGLQSACVVVPNDVLRWKVTRGLNTDEVAENNFFCVEANIAALNDGEEWLNELNLYIEENKKIFKDFINNNIKELYVVPSHATYLLWIDCSKVCSDTEVLCDFIRAKTGLYITAGSEYGKNGASFVRINLATQRTNVIDGANRLKKGIELFLNK